MLERVISHVQTSKDIFEKDIAFVIPSYQRPYVWSDDDVLKLLKDIIAVSGVNVSGVKGDYQPNYYIGTLLTSVKSNQVANVKNQFVQELIDGQQRTTTLMLIAICLKKLKVKSPMAELATRLGKPRLSFSIRDQVQSLLGFWAGLPDCQYPGDQAVATNPYLTRLHGALGILEQHIGAITDDNERIKLADYIYTRVQWVNNQMPAGTDLNRLFTTMNTSGIQLEQADILKSLLLKKINTDKAAYEAMWQACEYMGNYFERNVRQLFTASEWKAIQPDQLAMFDPAVFKLVAQNASSERNGKAIADLAAPDVIKPESEEAEAGKLDDDIFCRSIINFPLLLMHAYRIFSHACKVQKIDIEVRLHSDKLIESFHALINLSGEHAETEIKRFIECLWQVRYQFDRWVVKWVQLSEEKEEHLTLTSINFSKSDERLTRSPLVTSELAMLQSVRYFTGERSAQYWLTPFLSRLMDIRLSNAQDAALLLETIDNSLSLVLIKKSSTQKDASFELIAGECQQRGSIDDICSYLAESKGTGFEHYWFQKLEYILWKNRGSYEWLSQTQLRPYSISSKNSIEHVFPQNEEHGSKLSDLLLHSFGNLALLSPGENSSYGHQTVLKKRADFLTKPKYDSLKLAHLFSLMTDKQLEPTTIIQHRDIMLGLIRIHYLNQRV